MYKALYMLFSSNMLFITYCVCILLLLLLVSEERAEKFKKFLLSIAQRWYQPTTDAPKEVLNRAPGPIPLPIIGNLACLDGYEVPYQAFSVLREKYGDIISLQLGTVPAVVVNGIENIKEVMVHKGAHFDGRPNFRRYHQLFKGNKENCKLSS